MPFAASSPMDRHLTRALAAAAGTLGGAVGAAPITNNDIWLHLATGRWILDTGSLPRDEVFSFVAAGRAYVAHEWGSELLFIGLFQVGGLVALTGFKILAGILLTLWTYHAGRRHGAPASAAAALAGLAGFVVGAHLWVRPHLLSWLAVLVFLEILRRGRRVPGLLLALVPLQVAWTNVHGSFILGPVLVAGWAVGETLRRRWELATDDDPVGSPVRLAVISAACVAATLINPYGLELLRFPFELTGSAIFMEAVYEWRPPLTSSYLFSGMFAGFLVIVGLLCGGLIRSWRGGRNDRWRPDPCDLVIVAGLLVLALRMNRHVPLFALVAAPLAAAACSGLLPHGSRRLVGGRAAAVAVLTVLAAVTVSVLALGYPYRPGDRRPAGFGLGPRVPESACRYLEDNHIAGDAFTTYGEGAYVAWRLWPQVRIGMDSRNSVYGEALYSAYRRALWRDADTIAYLDRWPVDLAVVGHDGPFRRGPDQDPVKLALEDRIGRDHDLPHRPFLQSGRLALVDFDDVTAVYLTRNEAYLELIRRDAYEVIHPVLLPPVFPPEQRAAALREARRAVDRHPGAVLPRWILANALIQNGRMAEALEELAVLANADRPTIRSWGVGSAFEVGRLSLVGLARMQQGDCPGARQALLEALSVDPGYEPARRRLPELDCD